MLASGVVLGVLIGFSIRRTWRPLAAMSIRLLPLLVVAVGLRLLAPALPPLGLAMYELAMAATITVALANWRLPGAALILVGAVLNLTVVIANGGMPVDTAALAAAGAAMTNDLLHLVSSDSTLARPLADVIPIALFRSVYSVGDVGIALGGFVIPFWAFLRR